MFTRARAALFRALDATCLQVGEQYRRGEPSPRPPGGRMKVTPHSLFAHCAGIGPLRASLWANSATTRSARRALRCGSASRITRSALSPYTFAPYCVLWWSSRGGIVVTRSAPISAATRSTVSLSVICTITCMPLLIAKHPSPSRMPTSHPSSNGVTPPADSRSAYAARRS